jgi:hypothetical protein
LGDEKNPRWILGDFLLVDRENESISRCRLLHGHLKVDWVREVAGGVCGGYGDGLNACRGARIRWRVGG